MAKNTQLSKVLNEHSPCVIFPHGIERPPKTVFQPLLFVIAEGFIVKQGVFWFDTSWNFPMSGTGSAHHTKGAINGPTTALPTKYNYIKNYKQFWSIGNAYIFEIDKGFVIDGTDYYEIAMKSKTRSDKYVIDYYKSRQAAARIASRWLHDAGTK